MTVIASDSFNRANNTGSMGTADTGQVWSQVTGDFPFGILDNQAYWNRTGVGDAGIEAKAVLDVGLSNVKVSVRLMNSTAGGGLNLRNQGIVIRYVDPTHFLILVYFNASGTTGFRCYVADGGDAIARANGAFFTLIDGDEISFSCCDQLLKAYHNDVVVAETDFTLGGNGPLLSATLLGGTKHGIQATGGIIDDPDDFPFYEDFVIETNLECEGANWPLPALQWSASGVVVDNNPGVLTTRFDTGEGKDYYLVAPISDSGNELRSKTLKDPHVTGRLSNANIQLYAYDVSDVVNTDDLEAGTNATAERSVPDSTGVARGPKRNMQVKNAVLHTVRLEGDDTGNEERDEVHEIVVEQAIQGVRR